MYKMRLFKFSSKTDLGKKSSPTFHRDVGFSNFSGRDLKLEGRTEYFIYI